MRHPRDGVVGARGILDEEARLDEVARSTESDGLSALEAVVEELEKGRKYKIRVTLRKDAKPGYLKGSVNIRTNCPGEKTVRAWFHAFVSKN